MIYLGRSLAKKMTTKKRKYLREPLFLFVSMGVLLFILYSFLSSQLNQNNKQIVVNASQVAFLTETFKKTWNRDPTEKEITAQIENHIKDEVFYREAVAMGLDKSDPAVKRRLRQLLELMMDDASNAFPSEEQLRTYLQENAEKFEEDPLITFDQVYFAEDKTAADAQLDRSSGKGSIDRSQTSTLALLPSSFSDEPSFSIERSFGQQFTQQLFAQETGKWAGPIRSAYGWHLVYIEEIQAGKVPELDEIWDEVEREWALERKNQKKEQQYEQMKSNYKIVFEDAK